MPKIVKKSRVTKGKMARELVYYCLWALTAALAWAMVVKTAALLLDRTCDLSDVLVFAGAAFGGGAAAPACKTCICKTERQRRWRDIRCINE